MADLVVEPLIPGVIAEWMDAHHWGVHHALWHWDRLWDLKPDQPAFNKWLEDNGAKRAERQQGAPGNGLDFLAMHRHMLQVLRREFPRHESLFEGWKSVPIDPDRPADSTDRMPPNIWPRAFDRNMLWSLYKLESLLDSFPDDDAFGLFVETNRRPVPGNPRAISNDRTSGIHDYIHARFSLAASDPQYSVSMSYFLGNIKNQRFWRLHGWIDHLWGRFRHLKGFTERDPAYRQAMEEQREHMSMHHHAIGNPLDSAPQPDIFEILSPVARIL